LNPYLEPQGFFGTGASLLADLTLIAYILILIPAMLIGYSYARRGKHRPQHRWVMTGITIANWLLIVFLMFAAYRFDIVDNITRQAGNLRYLLPTVHGLLGLPAQILATFIIVRMLVEDRAVASAKRRGETAMKPYFWKSAKRIMQITLALWLATAILGIASYVIRYNVVETALAPGGAAPGDVQPVVTPEVVGTPEVVQTEEAKEPTVTITPGPSPTRRPTIALNFGAARPAGTPTPEVSETIEVSMTFTTTPIWDRFVVRTPEVQDTPEIAITPEVEADDDSDDDSGGRGRGRGRGGDDDGGNSGSG